MKNLVLSLMLFALCSAVQGQVIQFARYYNNSFNNTFSASASDITSDFGMRNPGTTGTLYHRGIDISPLGNEDLVILAPFEGRVARMDDNGIIDLIIESNAPPGPLEPVLRIDLLHIFDNRVLPIIKNGFKLLLIGSNYVIIDLVNCRAFCVVPGLPVSCNGNIITTINTFNAGWPIAPVGNSGGNAEHPYPYHVHLTQYENASSNYNSKEDCVDALHDFHISTTIEPLALRLRRRDFTPPNINLNCSNGGCEHDNGNGIWDAFVPTYINDTRNVIQTEVSMMAASAVPGVNHRYSNVFMNESLIKVNIRNTISGSFQEINGSNNFARFRIDPRGSNKIYPDNMNNNVYGNLSQTGSGCAPYSYTVGIGFAPWDYYLTPDFFLRIHKDNVYVNKKAVKLATYPWDARYVDGNYELQGQVTDINNHTEVSTPISFKIDNFKPFIRTVGIYSGTGATNDRQIYYREWVKDNNLPDGNLRLGGALNAGPTVLVNQVVTVYAVASESLRSLKAKIPNLANNLVNCTAVPGTDSKTWSVQFSSINFTLNACYNVVFEGEDLNGNAVGQGNQLLNLPQIACLPLSSIVAFAVPYRTGSNTWTSGPSQGQDQVHKFKINCGQLFDGHQSETENFPVTCITSNDVNYAIIYSTPQSSTGAIDLTVNGSTSGMSFTWTNSIGQTVGQSEDLVNVPAGVYCIEIKIDCCTFSDCIEVKNCTLSLAPTIKQPTPGATDGSILLTINNGIEPYQIKWNTGASTSTISGLAPGNYSVTVEDAFHCTTIRTLTLVSCPVIQVSVTPILIPPLTCDGTDGQIKVQSNPSASGGLAPYTYHWEDSKGNSLVALTNLSQGNYCLIATDANGCTGSKCFDLRPIHFPQLDLYILPSCTNTEHGSLGVFANDPEGGSYDFIWENGSEDYDTYYSELTNLSSGSYCVTIISTVASCITEQCLEVPTIEPDSPLQVTSSFTVPCPGANNGNINLTTTGGIPPYFYSWSGISNLNEDQSAIGAGTYAVTVTDYCGSSVVKNFVLDPLGINVIQALPGCQGYGQIQASVTGGTLPYSYVWSNGVTNSTITTLNSGNYCITVSDANSCTISSCIQLQNKDVTPGLLVKPCEGYDDGSVTYNIFNPLNDVVTVFQDGIPIGAASTVSNFEVTIGHLHAGINYHIDVNIGSCVKQFIVKLYPATLNHVWKSYDESSDVCTYDLYCKGELVLADGYHDYPILDLANAINVPCKVEKFCENHSVGWVSKHKKKVRALEYSQMLNHALNSATGSYFAYIQQLQDNFDGKFLDNCDKVTYCEATLEVVSTSLFNHPLYGEGHVEFVSNDCVKLDCGLFYEELLCGDLPSDLHVDTYYSNCEPRRENAYQLILWYDQLKAAYPDPPFEFTELGQKILWLKDVFDGVYFVEYPEPNKVFCTFVTFCKKDFSVLGVTPINSIDCGYDLSNPNFGCYENTVENVIACPGQNGSPYVVSLNPDFNKNFFFSLPGRESTNVFVPIGNENDFLKNFGIVHTDGFSTPKGLVRATSGKSSLVDYTYRTSFESRDEAPDYLFYIDDWDNDVLVFIEKVGANQIALDYDTPLVSWEHTFSSNDLLTISDMVKSGNQIIVTGTFRGNLNYDATNVKSATALSGFVAVIGLDGVIVRLQSIQNITADTKLEIRQGDGKYIISGTANSTLVKVDGQNQSVLNPGGLFSFQLDNLNPLQLSISGISTTGSVKFIKSISSKDHSRITYMFKGTGNLSYQQTTYALPSDGILLLTVDGLGSFKWMQRIVQPIIEGEMDLTYDDSLNVYLVLTFTGNLSINNQSFASTGGKDILFCKIATNGDYAALRSYGSPDNEVVKKCFFDNTVLYFGGEYSGVTAERQLGRSKLVNLGYNVSPTTSKAYMSYVTDQELETIALRDNNTIVEERTFELYPNPFSNDLIVRKFSNKVDQYTIEVVDMLGNLIVRQNEKAESGINEYRIQNLVQMPLGIYFVRITNTQGRSWLQKVVKN